MGSTARRTRCYAEPTPPPFHPSAVSLSTAAAHGADYWRGKHRGGWNNGRRDARHGARSDDRSDEQHRASRQGGRDSREPAERGSAGLGARPVDREFDCRPRRTRCLRWYGTARDATRRGRSSSRRPAHAAPAQLGGASASSTAPQVELAEFDATEFLISLKAGEYQMSHTLVS